MIVALNENNLVVVALCIIDAVVILIQILASINVEAFDHLQIDQLHLHFDVVLDAEVVTVVAFQLLLVFLQSLKECRLSHFLQHRRIVFAQCSHELSVCVEKHGVLLMVVIEHCALEMPTFEEVEFRALRIRIAALVEQLVTRILSHLLKLFFGALQGQVICVRGEWGQVRQGKKAIIAPGDAKLMTSSL